MASFNHDKDTTGETKQVENTTTPAAAVKEVTRIATTSIVVGSTEIKAGYVKKRMAYKVKTSGVETPPFFQSKSDDVECLSMEDSSLTTTVSRCYGDFDDLHDHLSLKSNTLKCGAPPEMPPKGWVRTQFLGATKKKKIISDRSNAFNMMLKYMVEEPAFYRDAEVLKFLGLSLTPSAAPQKAPVAMAPTTTIVANETKSATAEPVPPTTPVDTDPMPIDPNGSQWTDMDKKEVVEPEPEPEPEPVVVVEPEPIVVVVEPEPEPEPIVVKPEPEPEPIVVKPEPEPEPVVVVEPEPEPPAPVVVVVEPIRYSLSVLDNRLVEATVRNAPENIAEIQAFEKVMKSGRSNTLGIHAVSNRSLKEKKLIEDFQKVEKVIQCTQVTEPSDFDYQKAGDTKTVPPTLLRYSKALDNLTTWLNKLVDTYGQLEASKQMAEECNETLRPVHDTRVAMQQKFEMMNVRYNSTIVGTPPQDMTNVFRGTLKGKIKTLRSYTEKARNPPKAHTAAQDHRLYIKELKQMLTWAQLFKEKFADHPMAEPTLRQLREELVEARRDTDGIEGFETSLSMQYAAFMG